MIIFIEYGRLGNQLFQYAFLKTIAKEENLYLVGFNDFQAIFDNVESNFPVKTNSLIFRLLNHIRPSIYPFLRMTRIINLVTENLDKKKQYNIEFNSGFLKKITYCQTGYFQSEKLFDSNVITKLAIKPSLIYKVNQKFEDWQCTNKDVIFVHVRRGDFLKWPSRENPAILPANWYFKCIAEMQRRYENPFFIFTSDDLPYTEDLFGDMPDSAISNGSQEDDFALMSLCHGGILSASSFSWWAAYLAKIKHQEGVFFAPMFWVGHKSAQWYPSINIQSSFLEYITVS